MFSKPRTTKSKLQVSFSQDSVQRDQPPLAMRERVTLLMGNSRMASVAKIGVMMINMPKKNTSDLTKSISLSIIRFLQ